MPATVSTIGTGTPILDCDIKVRLPDITISENYVGALRPDAFIAMGSDFGQIISFDISEAKLKAYRLSDNAEITSTIIGDNTLIADPAPSKTNIADVVFKLKAASSFETGPIKIIISSLKITLLELSNVGQTIKIGSSGTSGASLDTLDKINSNLGSGATAQTLTIANRAAFLCTYNNAVVSGTSTARTVKASWIPPMNLEGRQGGVFVFALLPRTLGSSVYVMSNDSTWTIYTSCETAPAFYSGTLKKLTDIPIVPTPTDLTGLLGTQIYLGGDINADMSPGAACREMLNNGAYTLTYTIR